MKKFILFGLIGVMAAASAGCQKQADVPETYEYTETNGTYCTQTDSLTVYIDKNCLTDQQDRDAAVYRLQDSLHKAKDFLGQEYAAVQAVCRIQDGNGLTRIQNGELIIFYYDTVEEPYVDELIQLLAGTQAPDWLREGVGAYGADQAGESLLSSFARDLSELSELPEAGRENGKTASISELAKCLYVSGGYEKALELGDLLEGINQASSAEAASEYRAAYCIYAGSFVEYLADQKGMELILKVYQGADFEEAMGSTWEECRENWIQERLIG